METSTFILEKDFASQGFTHIIGTDEVGRGPLCGPVVACAAMYRGSEFPELSSEEHKKWDLIRDSKKLSEKQREAVFDFINEHFYVGIGLCDHETIDRINILEASFLAMKKAIQELKRNMEHGTWSMEQDSENKAKAAESKEQDTRDKNQTINNNQNSNINEMLESESPRISEYRNTRDDSKDMNNVPCSMFHAPRYIVLVDGNKIIPNLSMEQYAVIGGDKLVKSISAASIVAKVTRDRMMKEFAILYPQYGMEKHMGYGTKVHMEALVAHGPCPIHRKSFKPVRRLSK